MKSLNLLLMEEELNLEGLVHFQSNTENKELEEIQELESQLMLMRNLYHGLKLVRN